jgi:hypothetical protein
MQDGRTKDVFREMDGFISVMNVLSSIQPEADAEEDKAGGIPDGLLPEILESARLAFMLISEAMAHHPENAHYFSVRFHFFLRARINQLLDHCWLRILRVRRARARLRPKDGRPDNGLHLVRRVR